MFQIGDANRNKERLLERMLTNDVLSYGYVNMLSENDLSWLNSIKIHTKRQRGHTEQKYLSSLQTMKLLLRCMFAVPLTGVSMA